MGAQVASGEVDHDRAWRPAIPVTAEVVFTDRRRAALNDLRANELTRPVFSDCVVAVCFDACDLFASTV